MKNKNWIKTTVFLAVALFVPFVSCNDEMDKHYDTNPTLISGENLMGLIEQQKDLSVFASLLKQTGYDDLLRKSQSYTVWAPGNEAFSGMDLSDKRAVEKLVSNHIARFTHSASGDLDKKLYLINGKHATFKRMNDGYWFSDSKLIRPNLAAANGILHTIKQVVSFQNNLWEYLQNPELDSIRNYLYAFSERTFIPSQSAVIDINQEGMTVYDSVFQVTNVMWNTYPGSKGIGALNHEDSIYTMILPNNEAWSKSYEKISPYFLIADRNNHPYPQRVDSLQRASAQYAIVQDLVYRGMIADPESFGASDSLVSTNESVFYDPSYLFRQATQGSASNGLVYITDELSFKPWESFHKKVLVEAEHTTGRDDTDKNIKLPINNHYDGNSTTVSNKMFIEVFANSPSATTSVTFSIPGTLAASYNIYAVFVPFSDNQRKTKIQYQIYELKWRYAGGRWTQDQLQSLKAGVPSENVTRPTEQTKMLLVSNFKFPYANVDELNPTIKIKIIARSLTTQDVQDKYTNDLRIDCLLLEPVQQ